MGRVPGFLLRQKITVQPYLGTWGSYGPVSAVRCQITEKISTSRSDPGLIRASSVTVIAPYGTNCPAGSLITMPDGRLGYATSVASHTSGGMATPDHLEVAVMLGSPIAPALGAVTVTILHRVAADTDRYGTRRYTTTSVDVPGCAVRPLTSDEKVAAGRDQVVDTIEVIMPPGTDIGANDRLQVAGLVYEVDGTPTDRVDTMTGVDPGIRVIGKRFAG